MKLLKPIRKLLLTLPALARRLNFAQCAGNTTILVACAMPAFIGTTALAIDFATLNMKRATLQAAADDAAIAGAKQLALASSTDININSAVSNYLHNQLTGDDAGATNTTAIDHTANNVKVQVTENWTPFFAHFLSANVTPIITTATASLQGESRLCVLTLDPDEQQAFRMMNSAQLEASTCGVYSNSTDAHGMVLQNSSVVNATVICSAGGVQANKAQTNVTPQTDCPAVPDPLVGQAAPSFGGCTATSTVISTGVTSLSPGVYCGGINISGTATVTFNPGTYVIKDGPLKIAGTATVNGTNTGFYLTGTQAQLNIAGSASVSLSGAESGTLAGLLFFADPAQSDGSTHAISSANVKNLTGTIYLPSGDLRVDPNGTVADTSAFTAIIVKRLRIQQGPKLVMNTNYGATNVPVPAGVRTSATVVLSN